MSNLACMYFYNARFEECDFSDMSMNNANAVRAKFNHCKMHNTSCENLDMVVSAFSNVSMMNVNLSTCYMGMSEFDNCYLKNVSICDKDLSLVWFESTTFVNVNLNGSILNVDNLSGANFSGADLSQTTFHVPKLIRIGTGEPIVMIGTKLNPASRKVLEGFKGKIIYTLDELVEAIKQGKFNKPIIDKDYSPTMERHFKILQASFLAMIQIKIDQLASLKSNNEIIEAKIHVLTSLQNVITNSDRCDSLLSLINKWADTQHPQLKISFRDIIEKPQSYIGYAFSFFHTDSEVLIKHIKKAVKTVKSHDEAQACLVRYPEIALMNWHY